MASLLEINLIFAFSAGMYRGYHMNGDTKVLMLFPSGENNYYMVRGQDKLTENI